MRMTTIKNAKIQKHENPRKKSPCRSVYERQGAFFMPENDSSGCMRS